MQTQATPFTEMVLRHFDFLQKTYGFRVAEATGSWIVLASQACQVTVELDRIDLYVDISSVESEPIRRVRFSLGDLLEAKGADAPPAPEPPQSLDARVRDAAGLLARYGCDVLAGDWSIRAQIVRLQTLRWLQAQHRAVMAPADPRLRDQRIAQLAHEYRAQDQEHRLEAWQRLDEWLRADDVQKRSFAELVVSRL
jgi:hypothetical protein